MNAIDRYCSQIDSKDKHEWRVARAKLIENKDLFLKSKTELAKWVREALEKKSFPFSISQKKAGYIYKKYPLSFNQSQKAPQPQDVDQRKPAFVAIIPHAIPGDKKTDRIEHQLKLLSEETFGTTPQESTVEAKRRLRVVVGVNWPHSLDAQVNRASKAYLKTLEPYSSSTCYFEMFSWRSIWLDEKGKKADVKVPKRLFRLISEIDRKASQIILKKLNATKIIPMQPIREEIKNSEYIASFQRGANNRPIYLACMDDDAIHLKTDELGLFSHYDRMIAENPLMRVGTTGYIMLDPEQEFVETGSSGDLVVRIALGPYAYFPEPNFILLLDFDLKRVVFIRKGVGGGLEFLAVIENLQIKPNQRKFGAHGPIVTAANRAHVPKHMPAKLTKAHLLQAKNLASFRSFMQSSIHPVNGFSASVGRMYPRCGGRPLNKHYSAIFTSLCPIECAKAFKTWLTVYREIRGKILAFHEKQAVDPDLNKNAIHLYAEKKFKILWDARVELLKNKNITPSRYDAIYQKAKDVTEALFLFLENKIQSKQ